MPARVVKMILLPSGVIQGHPYMAGPGNTRRALPSAVSKAINSYSSESASQFLPASPLVARAQTIFVRAPVISMIREARPSSAPAGPATRRQKTTAHR